MARHLNIAFEIQDLHLAREISEDLSTLSGISMIHSVGASGDQGTAAFQTPPEIILLEDRSAAGPLLPRLVALREAFPLAALFVISADRQPEHIVEAMKAGASDYFVIPVDPLALQRAIEKVRAQRTLSNGRAGLCYSFMSSKGGLGATALAVNFAALLAGRHEHTVALCDLCLQAGDVATMLDMPQERTIADLCSNFHRLDGHFLKGVLGRHASGIRFLPAPRNQEDAEIVHPEHIEKICTLLAEAHSRVIIDCPSMLIDDCTLQAFNVSEKLFVIIDLSVPALRNAARLFSLLGRLGIESAKIEFVVNRYTRGSTLSLNAADKLIGKKIFWALPNDFENVFSSINRGVPLVTATPRAALAKSLAEFIDKLRTPDAAGDYRGVRGTFGKAV